MDLETRKNLLRCYYANNNSATAAIRQYKRENQLIKDPCSPSTVTRMVKKFERSYSLHNEKHGRNSLQNERSHDVAEIITRKAGRISIRQVSNESNIPCTSVYRVMKGQLSLKPFKYKMLQALEDHDFEQRIEFGNWYYRNEAIIPNVLWSDEAYLHLDGGLSRYHCQIWSQNNPRQFMTKHLHPLKVCVWIGFTSTFCLQPYFFEGTITAHSYLRMLQNHVCPRLKRICKLTSIIFQQDGAPAHFGQVVRSYLEEIFGADRIISRGCQIPWPPRSPDLTPVDYWFWGTLKARIFHRNPPTTIQELKGRVIEECERFTSDDFSNAVADLRHRIELLMKVQGHHFEHLI